ncbi:MAG: class I SAM-dependent methyltransferase [bacterium]|nr:class I SAM-dependent methyltransferase [bacterium]
MVSYQKFGQFYDAIMGDRINSAKLVRSLLRKYCPRCKSLLELACGTGSVLLPLSKYYTVYGLDLSPKMLTKAKQKLPGIKLYRQDMSSFSINKKFDAIICVFDSLNHLKKWTDWKRTFNKVHKHLNEGGVFLFDVNMEAKFRDLAAQPPWVHEFEDNLLIMNVSCDRKGLSTWNIKVFEHQKAGLFKLHEENIYEQAFPYTKIEKELRQKFKKVNALDVSTDKVSPQSKNLHFICVK